MSAQDFQALYNYLYQYYLLSYKSGAVQAFKHLEQHEKDFWDKIKPSFQITDPSQANVKTVKEAIANDRAYGTNEIFKINLHNEIIPGYAWVAGREIIPDYEWIAGNKETTQQIAQMRNSADDVYSKIEAGVYDDGMIARVAALAHKEAFEEMENMQKSTTNTIAAGATISEKQRAETASNNGESGIISNVDEEDNLFKRAYNGLQKFQASIFQKKEDDVHYLNSQDQKETSEYLQNLQLLYKYFSQYYSLGYNSGIFKTPEIEAQIFDRIKTIDGQAGSLSGPDKMNYAFKADPSQLTVKDLKENIENDRLYGTDKTFEKDYLLKKIIPGYEFLEQNKEIKYSDEYLISHVSGAEKNIAQMRSYADDIYRKIEAGMYDDDMIAQAASLAQKEALIHMQKENNNIGLKQKIASGTNISDELLDESASKGITNEKNTTLERFSDVLTDNDSNTLNIANSQKIK